MNQNTLTYLNEMGVAKKNCHLNEIAHTLLLQASMPLHL